jgi:serine/threonine protein kinase/tetratricopeptide (TPR) repeat protein
MATDIASIEAIFSEAVEIPSAEARAAYLDRACTADADLRRQVESLLDAHDRAGPFLASPTVSFPSDPPEPVGSTVGPYKLMEPIGEGGMGVVYVAEQTQPVRRKVALKIIKPGMDTKQVVARFEAERQALAMMDHPNIAKVHDGGATESGRPYFVMELVRGIPITEYCDREQLSIKERLELFVQVCRAVQHAHQKGIIHRDLKPSNVLVTVIDGAAVPKIIDFGVAKATGGSLTERTVYTAFHQLVGTPLYMSPEQADLSGMDMDTRSDIYSLGVLLYELLTGTTPFDAETLRTAAFDEVRRILREQEPPKPSTRLSSLGATRATVSANRKADARHLDRTVRGELDWIVMKALEKDRRRRYETSNDFASDVMRYLADQPVQAGPPSAWYRLRKFGRRHRAALTTTALVGVALVAGTVFSAWQAVRAARAGQLATRRLSDVQQANVATTAALKQSEDERRKAEAVKEFLVDAFRKPDPSKDGRDLKVVDLLDRAASRLEGESGVAPGVRGELLDALGHTYDGLGLLDRALSVRERAVAVRQAALGPDHRLTLASRHDLAVAYAKVGRQADAIRLEETTLKSCEAALGIDDDLTLASRNSLGSAYGAVGRTADAVLLLKQAQQRVEAVRGPGHRNALVGRQALAQAYMAADLMPAAIRIFEQTLEAMGEWLGPDALETLSCADCLAVAYARVGRTADAMPLYERTLRAQESKLGPDHPTTLLTRQNLARCYGRAGKTAEAIRQLELTLKAAESAKDPDRQLVSVCRFNLGMQYYKSQRWADAEPLLRDTVAWRRATPDQSANLAVALANLGECLLRQGKAAEAEPIERERLRILERIAPDDVRTFYTRSLLGGSLLSQKRYAEAEPLLLAGYEGMKQREATIPPGFKGLLTEAIELLVQLYEATGEPGKAAEWRARRGQADLPVDVFARP